MTMLLKLVKTKVMGLPELQMWHKRGKMTETEEKSASYITLQVVGGSSLVGLLFREFQNLLEEDKRSASRGDRRGKISNTD